MGKKDRQMKRFLGIKEGKPSEKPQVKFMNGMFEKTWYFERTFDKIIFLISILSLAYSLIRIIFTGFW